MGLQVSAFWRSSYKIEKSNSERKWREKKTRLLILYYFCCWEKYFCFSSLKEKNTRGSNLSKVYRREWSWRESNCHLSIYTVKRQKEAIRGTVNKVVETGAKLSPLGGNVFWVDGKIIPGRYLYIYLSGRWRQEAVLIRTESRYEATLTPCLSSVHWVVMDWPAVWTRTRFALGRQKISQLKISKDGPSEQRKLYYIPVYQYIQYINIQMIKINKR